MDSVAARLEALERQLARLPPGVRAAFFGEQTGGASIQHTGQVVPQTLDAADVPEGAVVFEPSGTHVSRPQVRTGHTSVRC